MHVKWVLAIVLGLLVFTSSAFLVDVGSGQDVTPASFDRTVTTGLTGVDVQQARTAGYEIPRVQVFYAQYQYVVGYYGVDTALAALDSDRTTRQFGRPLTVYVTDFSHADPSLTDDGYLRVRSDPAVGWVDATDAYYVVDSGARTPGGPAVVPFGERSAAEAFVDRTGGRILGWGQLRERGPRTERSSLDAFREAYRNRSEWADGQVERAASLRDRPVSVVVGEGAPTLRAAVERAPPNTTVRVPPGTYETNLTVEKPVTIDGSGPDTVLDGGGNGTVIRLRAPGSAITDLRITGVGDRDTAEYTGSDERWDGRIREVYGYGDTAVRVTGANRSLLADLNVETPASGVVTRDTAGVVVRNLTLEGTEKWRDGFMGVLAIGAPVVVENSTFRGGRDGVYLHDAPGTVVRHCYAEDLRYGVHEMYTSRTLVANNTARETLSGVIVMTRPRSNILVGNDVRDSRSGIGTAGSASFTVENTLVGNERGLLVGTQRSLYTRNTIVDNDLGLRTGTVLPTNDVVGNDIVANDEDVRTGRGPIRVWGRSDGGNYWGAIPGRDRDGDGRLERSYRPTGAIDSRLGESRASGTLADSPAVSAVRAFRRSVPGLRNADVVDPEPLTRPVRPSVLASLSESAPEVVGG